MAYAGKVPVKTDHVQCFGYFAEHIWYTFTRRFVYKGNEIVCLKKSEQPIITTIYDKDQKLSVTMESFWVSSRNKERNYTVIFYKMDL